MAAGRGKRWGLIALVVLAILIVGGIVGFRVAVGVLKGKVVEALGPDSEITHIRVRWSSVDVEAAGEAAKGAVQQLFGGKENNPCGCSPPADNPFIRRSSMPGLKASWVSRKTC